MASPGNIITNYYFSRGSQCIYWPVSREALSFLADRLGKEGLALADVASITVALRDMSDYAAVNDEYVKTFSSPNPPSRETAFFISQNCISQLFRWPCCTFIRIAKCSSTCELWTGLAWSREMPRLWLAFRESALRQVH